MPRKKTYPEVKKAFQDRGYMLIETSYIDSKTKIKYTCPKHPDLVQEISYNNLQHGYGCRPCSYELRAEMNKKYSYDDIIREFDKRGFKLLDKNYKNYTSKLRYVCPKHPDKINKITLGELKQGNGCPHCYNERRGQKTKGKNNPKWNGGKTNLGNYVRKHLDIWYEKSMDEYERKCFVTGDTEDVEIHHAQSLSDLLKEVISSLGLEIHFFTGDYSEKELELILKSVIEKHQEVLGVPLRRDIHRKFHNIYGRKNISFNDLVKFKKMYQET